MAEQIKIQTFNWGPCVTKFKIKSEYGKQLLDEAKFNDVDFRGKLAGQIDIETAYSEEAQAKMLPWLSAYFGVYDQAFERHINKKHDIKPHYVLSALWINYQKQNEFNPPPDHGGSLSWVIFLEIPEVLKFENSKYKGRSAGPGGITFIYGDGPRESVTHHSFVPEAGEMYIFPAWLKHWVFPFKSKCTRISVSGNVRDYIKIKDVRGLKPVTKEEVNQEIKK